MSTAATDQPPSTRKEPGWQRLWTGRVLYAFLTAAAGTLVSIAISNMVDGGAGIEELVREFTRDPTFWLISVFAVTVAPLLETALMGWIIVRLLRREIDQYAVMTISAFIWAALHRLEASPAAWVTFFPFFAYSFAYIKRSRSLHRDGFVVAALAHCIYNVTALATMIGSGYVP